MTDQLGTIDADLDPFFAVNLGSRTTGLPMNVWLSPRGYARCAACIWVQADHREQFDLGSLAVISLETDLPQIIEGRLTAVDLNRVRSWFALNQDAILDHWAERIDGAELLRTLKPLKPGWDNR